VNTDDVYAGFLRGEVESTRAGGVFCDDCAELACIENKLFPRPVKLLTGPEIERPQQARVGAQSCWCVSGPFGFVEGNKLYCADSWASPWLIYTSSRCRQRHGTHSTSLKQRAIRVIIMIIIITRINSHAEKHETHKSEPHSL
jgi:hypothetical protein